MELKLANNVVSQVDVARILRELNSLNDFFVGAAARQGGTPIQPPRLSRALDQLARENQVNLLEVKARNDLISKLNNVLAKAPILHISFASEPSPKSLEKVLEWLRANIHANTLLQVGLQPNIAVGCVLRTPNKIFDLSMRNYLEKQQSYLVELIAGAARG